MGKVQRAISEFRNVVVNNNVAQISAPIDAHAAILGMVEDFESDYFKDPSIANLAAATVLRTGRQNSQIHVFTVTTTFATGTYSIQYVETKPNATS